MTRLSILASLVLALGAGSVLAQQEVRQYRPGDSVDPREVAAILGKPPVKMRGLRLLDDGPAQQALATAPAAAGGGSQPEPAYPPARADALSLPVQFAFDSAEILPAARQQLDALAEGIRLLPPRSAVVIQGHTDASGSDQYNEMLSQRRAFAVKRYLVAMHSIEPARLRAVGMGEYEPLPGRDPYASENRRVQFRGE